MGILRENRSLVVAVDKNVDMVWGVRTGLGMRTKIARCWISGVVELCLESGYRQAVKYVSTKLTVKATRQWKPDGRTRRTTLLLSIGVPSYRERRFIKACVRAGEPFPVKKIQVKEYR